jgi:hypothetical protein
MKKMKCCEEGLRSYKHLEEQADIKIVTFKE